MKSARFVDILKLLAVHEVEFIVVGMAAGILAGAPLTTLDVDIVHKRSPDNVDRLMAVLKQLHAVYRFHPEELEPTRSNLLSTGHQLFRTTYGDFDCLGTIDDGKSYEDLLANSREIELSGGLTIRLLDLRTLIEIKKRAARPKDLAALPVLEATLAEQQRRG